jgi:hypothetical protein
MLISLVIKQPEFDSEFADQTHIERANISTKVEFNHGCVKKSYLEVF